MRESVTIPQVLALLNEAMLCDPKAVGDLIEQRVLCNTNLVEHPTIQVVWTPDGGDNRRQIPKVGLLGVLNGIFGVDDRSYGPITAIFDDDQKTLLRFERTRSPVEERKGA